MGSSPKTEALKRVDYAKATYGIMEKERKYLADDLAASEFENSESVDN